MNIVVQPFGCLCLIENYFVEAIVILPRNMFYSTDISVTLWIINKNKKARVVERNGEIIKYRERQKEILFMDLRRWGSEYEKKYIQLTKEDIGKITSNYHNWQRLGHEKTYKNIPEYCYSANLAEIMENDGWKDYRRWEEEFKIDKKERIEIEIREEIK